HRSTAWPGPGSSSTPTSITSPCRLSLSQGNRPSAEQPALGQEGASQPPLVNLTGITKRYSETRALADAQLRVGIGEIVGIVGHNGAGKSTLMRVLGGTTTPDAGSILVRGRDVTHGFSVDRARTLGIRSVYQEISLCPN